MLNAMVRLLPVGVMLLASAFHFVPQSVSVHDAIGGACVAGPSPCRATNAVKCLGAGCNGGNWDECLVGCPGTIYNCLNNDRRNGLPTHCKAAGCTPTCSELCWDANGDAP